MRAFVTGGSGFVGTWLRAHLEECGDDVVAPEAGFDVTDPAMTREAMSGALPDAVYHVAGLAHVGLSWQQPEEFFRVNAGGTLQVLEAARRCEPVPRVLLISSAEVYGNVTPAQLPLREDSPFRPVSPYAASKAAAELVGLQAHLGHGVPVIRVRPFNHAGPGQHGTFVVTALAERIVAAQASGAGVLTVGNVSPRRDITDVRDVVRAYRLLIERGEPGEVYNVCSGSDVAIEQLVRRMLDLAGADLKLEPDPDLLRPADVPVLRGDPGRLRAATAWEPRIPLDDTLRAVLDSLRRG
ncbi:MAG TPA: GDP-mannose 4,6-dehydratase [Acidimicrobiales bacterium]|nr:GDP-mannose 4,6-dehydratase [Acidimicrobiales bacterium]